MALEIDAVVVPWRLQYSRVIEQAGTAAGLLRLE